MKTRVLCSSIFYSSVAQTITTIHKQPNTRRKEDPVSSKQSRQLRGKASRKEEESEAERTFMADSVAKGWMMVLNSSIRGAWGTDFLGYLGALASRRVLGRWKETEVRIFRWAVDEVPLRAAFLAALALTSEGLPATTEEQSKGGRKGKRNARA
jgi:hypothetical protein